MSTFDDELQGTSGNDFLEGDDDDELLVGAAGDDTLIGGGGNDQLVAGGGEDDLTGGSGDDVLLGGGQADVYRYSFDDSGTVSESFTDWLAGSGHTIATVTTGSDTEVANGENAGAFQQAYHDWLDHLVETYDLGGDGADLDSTIGVGVALGSTGMPNIEGMSAAEVAELFSEHDDFTSNANGTGGVRHYMDQFTIEGGVTSSDGHDTIHTFHWGEDKLDFGGVESLQFEDLFSITDVDTDGDSVVDATVIMIEGNQDFSITITGNVGHTELQWAQEAIQFTGI